MPVRSGPAGQVAKGLRNDRKLRFFDRRRVHNERFGGNPLAVLTDGRCLSDCEMQAIAREINLSETTFVLPPEDPANTAHVRIFNRPCEMAFAGHPNVGTAFVLAASGACASDVLRFEEQAGLVEVRLVRNAAGQVTGAAIDAPQPLVLLGELDPGEVAACVGIGETQIVTQTHRPIRATIGSNYVVAEARDEALSATAPDAAAFARTAAAHGLGTRLPILIHCRSGPGVRARMFAPLEGTPEDPATGGAIAALGALLLSFSDEQEFAFEVSQGVEMGRPSRPSVRAWRQGMRSAPGSPANACRSSPGGWSFEVG